eukprot:5754489-Prymnesium_polylepis.1
MSPGRVQVGGGAEVHCLPGRRRPRRFRVLASRVGGGLPAHDRGEGGAGRCSRDRVPGPFGRSRGRGRGVFLQLTALKVGWGA